MCPRQLACALEPAGLRLPLRQADEHEHRREHQRSLPNEDGEVGEIGERDADHHALHEAQQHERVLTQERWQAAPPSPADQREAHQERHLEGWQQGGEIRGLEQERTGERAESGLATFDLVGNMTNFR